MTEYKQKNKDKNNPRALPNLKHEDLETEEQSRNNDIFRLFRLTNMTRLKYTVVMGDFNAKVQEKLS